MADDDAPLTADVPGGRGAMFYCGDCGRRTLRQDRCPACGGEDLRRVEPGP